MTARQPQGIPTGGQFSASARTEPEVDLGQWPSMQTDAPLQRGLFSSSNSPAEEYLRQHDEGELELNAPYQRGSVWTDEQRRNLVRSWRLGLPIPSVIVNTRSNMSTFDGKYDPRRAVIDGKQRIETAIAWLGGELDVPASWFPSEDIETTHDTPDGPYVTFGELSVAGQRRTRNQCMLPTVEAKAGTVEEEAQLFSLINFGGTDHDTETMERAALMGGTA